MKKLIKKYNIDVVIKTSFSSLSNNLIKYENKIDFARFHIYKKKLNQFVIQSLLFDLILLKSFSNYQNFWSIQIWIISSLQINAFVICMRLDF